MNDLPSDPTDKFNKDLEDENFVSKDEIVSTVVPRNLKIT